MSFAQPDSAFVKLIRAPGFVPLVGLTVFGLAVWALGGIPTGPGTVWDPYPGVPPTPYPVPGEDGYKVPGEDKPPVDEGPKEPTYH